MDRRSPGDSRSLLAWLLPGDLTCLGPSRICHARSLPQPLDLCLLSPAISAYSAVRGVVDRHLRSTVSHFISSYQPLDQRLSAALSSPNQLHDQRLLNSVPSWSCVWKPRVFPDDARECQCPFELFLHSQGGLRRGVRASGSPQLRTGKSGSFNMGHQPRGLSRISSRGRPHPERRREGREPLPDHAGESTLLSRTGED